MAAARPVRAQIVLVGSLAAVTLWFLGAVFDLNGAQWDWWSVGAEESALLVVVLTAVTAVRRRGPLRRPLRRQVVAMLAGASVVAASVAIMASRYSDPYAGPLLWPHVLAVVAAVGLAVVAVGAATVLLGSTARGAAAAR
jgi:hypothetical protein